MKQRKPTRTGTDTRMKLLGTSDYELVVGGNIPKQGDSGSGSGTPGCSYHNDAM